MRGDLTLMGSVISAIFGAGIAVSESTHPLSQSTTIPIGWAISGIAFGVTVILPMVWLHGKWVNKVDTKLNSVDELSDKLDEHRVELRNWREDTTRQLMRYESRIQRLETKVETSPTPSAEVIKQAIRQMQHEG